MRFFIQSVAENEVAEKGFSGTTVRGILRPEQRKFLKQVFADMRPSVMDGKPVMAGRVQAGDLELFSERMVRGIYFHHFGKRLRGTITSTNTHIVLPGHNNIPAIAALEEMAFQLPHGTTTDDRVYSYKYGEVVEPGGTGFLLRATFYETATFFVLAADRYGFWRQLFYRLFQRRPARPS